MLAEQRRTKILELMASQSAVSIKALTQTLNVTRETVRKDLEYLAQSGFLHQVRGGAVRVLSAEPPIEERNLANSAGKKRIAAMVRDRVPNGAAIIIDSGSTTLAAVLELAETRENLRVFTNDTRIAQLIQPAAERVTFLGGDLDHAQNATFGFDTIEHLRRYRAEIALIGVGGLTASALATDFNMDAVALRECMMEQAETAYFLVDSEKFGRMGRCQLRFHSNVQVLCDEAPGPEITSALASAGVPMDIAVT